MLLFHAEPDGFAGLDRSDRRLVPLSQLARVNPTAYTRAAAKYADDPTRQRLAQCRIPRLDCRWDEVVFLSPFDPRTIWRFWSDLGGEPLPPRRFLGLPTSSLDGLPAVWFVRTVSAVGDDLDPSEVSWFDPDRHRPMTVLPPDSQQWLRKQRASGRTGGWWAHTPHVLVAGDIDVADATVIDWSSP